MSKPAVSPVPPAPHDPLIDPYHVQISRSVAARIIGRSVSEFDKLRKRDPRCPKGIPTGPDPMARIVFRLGEIYDYSEVLLADGAEYERERARAAAAANQDSHPPSRDRDLPLEATSKDIPESAPHDDGRIGCVHPGDGITP